MGLCAAVARILGWRGARIKPWCISHSSARVVIEQVSANSRPLQNKGLKRGGGLQLYDEAVFVLLFCFFFAPLKVEKVNKLAAILRFNFIRMSAMGLFAFSALCS